MAPAPALAGITVLDLSSVGPASRASRILADYGATVVKVGPISKRSSVQIRPAWFSYGAGRGTRRARLDLKAPGGRTAFLRLAAAADVVIESFRPGVAARIGIGYDDGRLEVRSGKDGRVLRTVECSTDMKPISLVLLRGQRLHDDVVAALKPVLAEIESGGFVVDVPHVRANGEVWEAAMAVKWSWG